MVKSFQEQTLSGGSTGSQQPSCWSGTGTRPDDDTFQVEMSFLLKDATGQVHAVHERHDMGLFSSTYVQTLREAGFEMVEASSGTNTSFKRSSAGA